MKHLVDALDVLLEPELTEAETEQLLAVVLDEGYVDIDELALEDAELLAHLGLTEGLISKLKAKFRAKMVKGARATHREQSSIAQEKGIHTPEGAKAHFKAVKAGAKVEKHRSERRASLVKALVKPRSPEETRAAIAKRVSIKTNTARKKERAAKEAEMARRPPVEARTRQLKKPLPRGGAHAGGEQHTAHEQPAATKHDSGGTAATHINSKTHALRARLKVGLGSPAGIYKGRLSGRN